MTTNVMTRPVLKMGSKGPDVAKVQIALQNAGFSPGDIDSNFGLKTDQAVRYFQIDNHLEVDGIVGRHTWALLQRFYTSPHMRKHKVQQGETFSRLAEKYHVDVDEIIKANPGIDPRNLQVGQVVNIPNAGESVNNTPHMRKHKVQQGETFSKLAEKYHVDVDEIIKANPGIDPRNLQVGQVVNIPNAGGGYIDSSSFAERLETTWRFFKSLEFLDGATAGIMGNLRHESPTLDPHQIQGNDPRNPGRGICQWETRYAQRSTKYSGRWENLIYWANARGKEVFALSTQLEFLWHELDGGDQETVHRLQKYGGVNGLKKLSLKDAVEAFQWSFERAGRPDYPSRIKYANEIFERFAKRV
ncbi:phage tail tip lysozyme [Bacillus wiedmannii]|uniref:phage tail tip lysozyme n=1 Tax=Bacillus wiedmannii TaxID=1890302 RepID=UPI000B62660D|nr:hypothetical protein BK740_17575 [Bacillus thuringiensis serovar argentinensis]